MHFVDAKGIISANNCMNIYRGCSHGCIYCDGRSDCYNFSHDFEDIEVKQNAPQLLEKTLKTKRKKCMVVTGGMGDPYIHLEEKLVITRKCIEIIDKYEYGLAIQTKSARILRDIDLLKSINEKSKCVVQLTMTTYDEDLCKKLEPNVSTTKERFEVLMKMKELGIPTVVWLSPILPMINDTPDNINGILDYCERANVKGIICFGMGVTLRAGDREYFYEALDKHFPGMKHQYIRKYGNAYEINSDNNKELMGIYYERCKKAGIMSKPNDVFKYVHEYESPFKQLTLFDGV